MLKSSSVPSSPHHAGVPIDTSSYSSSAAAAAKTTVQKSSQASKLLGTPYSASVNATQFVILAAPEGKTEKHIDTCRIVLIA